MKQVSILVLLFVLSTLAVFADNVSFVAKAPNAVAVGQRFSVEYILNTNGGDLRVDLPKTLDVLAGPNVSRRTNVSIGNGQTINQTISTFTYIVKANAEGELKIPEAQINANGTVVKSQALSIKVVPASAAVNSQPQVQSAGQAQDAVSQSEGDVNKLFMRGTLSKTKVYEQEALVYTLRVYSRYQQLSLNGFADPVFTGFLSQNLNVNPSQSQTTETVNGHLYAVNILAQYLLFPQHSGTLTIPAVSSDFIVPVRVSGPRTGSVFDGFFDAIQNVNTTAKAAAQKVEVMPLPTPKPANFSGGVGNFELTSSVNNTKLQVNQPLTLDVTIKGKGNMKFLYKLKPQLPPDFEVYEPKVTQKINTTTAGEEGSINNEYLAVARHEGNYEIPSISFSYFDIASKTYKTLNTPVYTLEVAKGNDSSSNNSQSAGAMMMVPVASSKEKVNAIGYDIKYIQNTIFPLQPKDNYFFNSLAYWLWILGSLFIALIVFIVLNKYIQASKNIALQKTKKASKMVQRRLKAAHLFMKNDQREPFYDEILKAMLNYLSDKLGIPTSELTKDNAEAVLQKHQAQDEEIKQFMDVIHSCEYARYSPSKGSDELNIIYKQAASVIGKIDGQIKTQK